MIFKKFATIADSSETAMARVEIEIITNTNFASQIKNPYMREYR